MRTLIYVPIIYSSADLGSLANDVAKRGIAKLGEEVWREHENTVLGFWMAISKYFNSIKVTARKIYQDNIVANGEVGQKIVEEGVKSSSQNHELILRLLKRGAILVKIEDFSLVKKERDSLIAITQAKSIGAKVIALLKYKLVKNKLLNKRDEFIARTINVTLNPGQTGIIFIGAYHNIKKRLPKDIQIREVKDITKVREYQRIFPFYKKHKKTFEELRTYLISEIANN